MKYDNEEMQAEFEAKIVRAHQDLSEGRWIVSTGNFLQDMALFDKREAEGWLGSV